ncbi:hypothetical protein ABMC89_03010 [Sulfitobacter sp. HNIBRBA3233]|uniref:hypothetical protein n=1 Tax=Sulfitobacter marinivivus TaxID=3158558 RepID=UPI0032DFA790
MVETNTVPDYEAMARNMAKRGWHFHKHADGPFDRFQVMGERGCGTNILRKSINRSLEITRTEALGWKHGFPVMVGIPTDFLTICVVRNAKSWAQSLYKRPWHADPIVQQRPFAEFLRGEWIGQIDQSDHFELVHRQLRPEGHELQWDRHPLTGQRFRNIFEMRNLKHRGLLSFLNRGTSVAFVQLEVFNADPRGFLDALAEAYGLVWTEEGFVPVRRRMGNLWKAAVPREDPPETWARADLMFMRDQLEPQIERFMGYDAEA